MRVLCVFLLCHSDDVALASRRMGALARPSPSMPNVPGHSTLPRTSGSQGLLGSGISWWEETAEACVASALANQHSHRTHMHARCPNLCSPPIIPSSFFSIRRGQTPTKAWAHKSQRGRGRGEGTKARWGAWSKLTGLLSHHWCWFKLITCKNSKWSRRDVAWNLSFWEFQFWVKVWEHFFLSLPYSSCRFLPHRGRSDIKNCQLQLCNSNDIHAFAGIIVWLLFQLDRLQLTLVFSNQIN